MKKSNIYAIIPSRSGSKGFKDKNIKELGGKPLMAYSIDFAKKLGVDKIICSTDSGEYAKIAQKYGAEVPFLRSSKASADNAMEEDILEDLYKCFDRHDMLYPDIIVWLRPTFVFRDLDIIKKAISTLIEEEEISAVRTICESESRLYRLTKSDKIEACFEDYGKSMIRRQDMESKFKVFSTDVFRGIPKNISDSFLGDNVKGLIIPKLCGLDIDDEDDFIIVESLIKNSNNVQKYMH
ncbi:cytidylyltransferase domain-containing protein [Cellulophaga fucicola]|uniref:N-acylneuraminate cytidylyltransferase n=1 Tax=Cellulophaga fucicola TaxID=76595 RepID=A0A1K1Q9C0_9FLAO|nr:hypothetical protein [Cellulophaga fucicola]SFW56546.1 N-acylneuraminate cytidylyltransferase [Cellulophaga fucicola]